MKSNHILLFITLLIGIFLINGCATPTTQTSHTSDCPAVDGTWKGVISDSGSLRVTRYDAEGNPIKTNNPFTAQYDFEMTLECAGKADLGDHWMYDITKVKASHPIFGCTDGCVPVSIEETECCGSWLELDADKGSGMEVEFPNGAMIGSFASHGSVEFSKDGQKLMLYIQGGQYYSSIGDIDAETDNYREIETDNCKRLGGEGDCYVDYINKNTIILNKIG
ncbi:MAG: hypothetical protein ABIA62_08315 [Candidatus Woesearchaeota archaeon]